MQVRDGRVARKTQMTGTLETPGAPAREHDRQIVGRVGIAVAHAATVDDGDVVEEGALAIGGLAEAFEEVRELRGVVRVHLDERGDLLRVLLMMRCRMV